MEGQTALQTIPKRIRKGDGSRHLPEAVAVQTLGSARNVLNRTVKCDVWQLYVHVMYIYILRNEKSFDPQIVSRMQEECGESQASRTCPHTSVPIRSTPRIVPSGNEAMVGGSTTELSSIRYYITYPHYAYVMYASCRHVI